MLPGDASASLAGAEADRGSWLVGARPGAAGRRVAARFGARALGRSATYVVAPARARALATALRREGRLLFAQPNVLRRTRQGTPDPLSANPYDWRSLVVGAGVAPPAVSAQSPLLALVDSPADAGHPEWAGGNFAALPGGGVPDAHGTATASVAAAPVNGVGMVGVWPGMRALNVPLPERISCADSAAGIQRARISGAAVINMSYGSPAPCYPEFVEIQTAVRQGIIPVAAAGNEFAEGNPLEFPASLPHVITAAATTPQNQSAYFSNANAAIDLSAPGVQVRSAVPGGWALASGTSFSAPMVAAAAAWLRAARPDLSPDQVANVIRLSATDLGRRSWDPVTGFGLLNVGAALGRAAPPRDAGEPNDNLVWVNGEVFGSAGPAIWSRRGRVELTALLDRYEDPADVYRVIVAGRGRARVSVKPGFGAVDLSAHRRQADTLWPRGAAGSTSRAAAGRARTP